MNKIPAQILLTDEEGTERWVVNINSITEEQLKADGITKYSFKEDIQSELEWISNMLEWSEDLRSEVVQFALLYMKRHPELSPAQAMSMGYNEWVK